MNLFVLFIFAVKLYIFAWPQPGYIHPDEFFQSVEVAANSSVAINAKLPWEFELGLERPIRSALWPMVFVAPGLRAAQFFTLLQPSHLLQFARLGICLLSLLTDYAVWKLGSSFNKKIAKFSVLLWMSSYINWVMMTRTLNNAVETSFVIFLLYTISESFTKNSSDLTLSRRSNLLGFLVTVGIFLRPTFPIFATVPMLFWLVKLFSNLHSNRAIRCLVVFAMNSVLSCCYLIAFDSIYYRYGDLQHFLYGLMQGVFLEDVFKRAVVITPYNFILYQMDSKNLALHGLHSRTNHVLVNMPLLIGPLYLLVLFGIAITFIKREGNLLSLSLVGTIIASLIGISQAPHQELRFLMPLAPICCLMASEIMHRPGFPRAVKNLIMATFLIFNMVVGIFFSCFHQSQVVSLSRSLQDLPQVPAAVGLSCSYTFPNFLLAKNSDFTVDDLGTVDESKMLSMLQTPDHEYYAFPSHYLSSFKSIPSNFEITAKIFPAFSGECLPSDLIAFINKQSLLDIFTQSSFVKMLSSTFDVCVGTDNNVIKGICGASESFVNITPISGMKRHLEFTQLNWNSEADSLYCGRNDGSFGVMSFKAAKIELLGQKLEGSICGLNVRDDEKLLLCTAEGNVHRYDLKSSELDKLLFNPGKNLRAARYLNNYMATGGDENELKLFDIDSGKAEPVFQAKNLPDDWLRLRQPVLVKDIGFIEREGLTVPKIVTVTGNGFLRIYDPKVQRRPVVNVKLTDHPLVSLCVFPEISSPGALPYVAAGSAQGWLGIVDFRLPKAVIGKQLPGNCQTQRRIHGRCTQIAGSIRAIQVLSRCDGMPLVFSCGLDRFVRIYDSTRPKSGPMAKIFSKSKLNCLAINPNLDADKLHEALSLIDRSVPLKKPKYEVEDDINHLPDLIIGSDDEDDDVDSEDIDDGIDESVNSVDDDDDGEGSIEDCGSVDLDDFDDKKPDKSRGRNAKRKMGRR